MSVREKIIDSLHWKQYMFVGQDNAIFEGSLTQESEEQITDQILKALASSLPDMSEEEILKIQDEPANVNDPYDIWEMVRVYQEKTAQAYKDKILKELEG